MEIGAWRERSLDGLDAVAITNGNQLEGIISVVSCSARHSTPTWMTNLFSVRVRTHIPRTEGTEGAAKNKQKKINNSKDLPNYFQVEHSFVARNMLRAFLCNLLSPTFQSMGNEKESFAALSNYPTVSRH